MFSTKLLCMVTHHINPIIIKQSGYKRIRNSPRHSAKSSNSTFCCRTGERRFLQLLSISTFFERHRSMTEPRLFAKQLYLGDLVFVWFTNVVGSTARLVAPVAAVSTTIADTGSEWWWWWWWWWLPVNTLAIVACCLCHCTSGGWSSSCSSTLGECTAVSKTYCVRGGRRDLIL